MNLIDTARSRVRAGTLKAPWPFDLKEVEPKNLDRIKPCRAAPGMVCYQFVLRSSPLITVVAQDENADAKTSPEDIVSVSEAVLIDDNPDGWP